MEMARYSVPLLIIVWSLLSLLICVEAWNHTEYKYPDIEGERHKDRLLGIGVSIAMCMIFVVMFCISFTYYRLKAIQQHRLEEQQMMMKESASILIKRVSPRGQQSADV